MDFKFMRFGAIAIVCGNGICRGFMKYCGVIWKL